MEQSPNLKGDVVGIIIPSFMWLVRSDVKQYFPADMFVLMRFTNLTKEEILVGSLNVETIGKTSAPLTLFPLDVPDECWRMYCGPGDSLTRSGLRSFRFVGKITINVKGITSPNRMPPINHAHPAPSSQAAVALAPPSKNERGAPRFSSMTSMWASSLGRDIVSR